MWLVLLLLGAFVRKTESKAKPASNVSPNSSLAHTLPALPWHSLPKHITLSPQTADTWQILFAPENIHTESIQTVYVQVCILSCIFACLKLAYFAPLLRWTFLLSLSHLCFFLSAPSVPLPLWLSKSQISASSGCRLYHQLPSLTPYLTFSLPFLFILFYRLSPSHCLPQCSRSVHSIKHSNTKSADSNKMMVSVA